MNAINQWFPHVTAAAVLFMSGFTASAQSPPREPWLLVTPTSDDLWGVTFGQGQFVVVGEGGTVLTSTDGAHWTIRKGSTNQVDLLAVTFGGNQFVAVGRTTPDFGNPQPVVWTSPDGITWTSHDMSAHILTFGHWLQGVTHGGGLYVAVGGNATTNTVLSSPDGAVWTMRDSHLNNSGLYPLSAVAYGNGVFVAAGAWLITSPDGFSWSKQNSSGWYRLYAATFAAGRFVAVGPYSQISSINGTNWTIGSPPTADYIYGVTYGDGYYVCLGYQPAYTTNGVNWIRQTNGATGNAIAHGNSVFVAVGSGGKIYRTASTVHASVQKDAAARLTLTGLVPGTCRIDASSNLIDTNNWTTLATVPLTNSPANWIDESSTNVSMRFYRVIWNP